MQQNATRNRLLCGGHWREMKKAEVDKLNAIYNGFNVDYFIDEIALLSDVLEGIGVDFSFATTLPENKEEYVQRCSNRF
jgi:hypothetical protein